MELLDAFAYGNLDLGNVGLTLRGGRFTQVYGETLFFGSNGIGDAQGPIDIFRLIQVPGTQFKEVLRPVEQISCDAQLTSNLSFGAYYQFKWHESRIPAAGSYLSNAEIIGEGTESWILGPGVAMTHRDDLEADDDGQGGARLRYTLDSLGIDLGLYAARYHAKTPSGAYIDPVVTMNYRWGLCQGHRYLRSERNRVAGPAQLGHRALLPPQCPPELRPAGGCGPDRRQRRG